MRDLSPRTLPNLTADPAGPSKAGDMYYNSTSVSARLCTIAGTPGTWKDIGSTYSKAAARIYSSTSPSIPNNVLTAIPFNAERQDEVPPGFTQQHDTATLNTRLVCRVPGWYVIVGTFYFNPSAGGSRRLSSIRLNGTTEIAGAECPPGTASTFPALNVASVTKLAVGDYVELSALQDSGGALSLAAAPQRSPELGWVLIDGGAPVSGWSTVTYGTNWRRLGNSASFEVQSQVGADGRVLLRGIIERQTSTYTLPNVIATLPVGMRPSVAVNLWGMRSNAANTTRIWSRLVVGTDGTISVTEEQAAFTEASTDYIFLDGLVFSTL